MKNPLILFSISSLCKAFEEWVPKLHAAMKSCLDLSKNHEGNNDNIDLKYFLDGPAFADVSYLARMCFDCGVYGLEGMESLQEVSCDGLSSAKQSSISSLEARENTEMTDLNNFKDGELNVLVSNSSDMELKFDKCDASSSHEGIVITEEPSEASISDGSTTHTEAVNSNSISTNVEEENCKGNTLNGDSTEIPAVTVVEVNSEIIEPPKITPHEVNATLPKYSNNTSSSHKEISSDVLSTNKSQESSFNSAPNCEPICGLCKSRSAFFRSDIGEANTESSTQHENDSIRSKFLAYYFFLLDVKQLRRTLFMSRGDRRMTWNTFVNCLSG